MKKKKIKACPECLYDIEAGGIVFDNKDIKIVPVESVENCELYGEPEPMVEGDEGGPDIEDYLRSIEHPEDV